MIKSLALILALYTASATADRQTSDYIRTQDGELIRAGDEKTQVLNKLGFPDMQEGGTFYYRIDGKLYQIRFTRNDEVSWIKRARD